MIIKDQVLDAIGKLPDDSTYEDILEVIYVQQKILKGLEESKSNLGISHEEFIKHIQELRNRIKKA